MGYYVRLRRNGRKVGELGPFSTQAAAVRQGQVMADDAAKGVVVTVEPQHAQPKRKANKAKVKPKRRRRNYSPVPGSPPLASATDGLVDWTPMNARTRRAMERSGMAPKKNTRKKKRKTKRSNRAGQLKLF